VVFVAGSWDERVIAVRVATRVFLLCLLVKCAGPLVDMCHMFLDAACPFRPVRERATQCYAAVFGFVSDGKPQVRSTAASLS